MRDELPNNRLKLAARGRSAAESRLRTRSLAGALGFHEKDVIPERERPKLVTTIGWFWVIAGIVKATTLTFYLHSLRGQLLDPHDTALALRSVPSWFAQAVSFVFGHLEAFNAFWVALGVFMVIAGAFVLRGRSWAHLGLELVCWFGLFEAPFVGAFLYFMGRSFSSYGLPAADRLASQVFKGIWICAGWLTIYVVVLVLLRDTAIRSWVARTQVIQREA